MSFGLKFISIVSIAGVLAWAASAAPLQPSGAQSEGFGYGYGGTEVTICHIPPGNPDNAHTITVGAPAVPAHLAHGDTLGPCPNGQAAAEDNGNKANKPKDTEESDENGVAGAQETTSKGKGDSKKNETPTAESSTTETEQVSPAPTPQQDQKKPKKEKPAQSNGVAQDSAPTSDLATPGNGNGNGNGGGNGNAGGNGNGNAKGKSK
jgi:hypothetical protein